jgi:hypothetical protein
MSLALMIVGTLRKNITYNIILYSTLVTHFNSGSYFKSGCVSRKFWNFIDFIVIRSRCSIRPRNITHIGSFNCQLLLVSLSTESKSSEIHYKTRIFLLT